MNSNIVLQLNNLHARISATLSLENIDFALAAGEVLVAIGPNGAGKTSLLRAICNELEWSSGSVEMGGVNLQSMPVAQRAKVMGILPQRSTLEFPFTVSEVVSMGRIPHSSSAKTNAEIVTAALTMVDCLSFADRNYVNLSGGEKQRVQLARVAAQIWEEQDHDRCLILDEPSASLDLAHQAMIVDMIKFFAAQGVAVLTVFHDLNLASKCANRIAVLDQGCIQGIGVPEEILTQEMLATTFGIDALISANEKDGSRLVIT